MMHGSMDTNCLGLKIILRNKVFYQNIKRYEILMIFFCKSYKEAAR